MNVSSTCGERRAAESRYSRSAGVRAAILAAFGAALFGLFMFTLLRPMVRQWTLHRPPEVGDGPDYDSIALSMLRGRGFSLDYDDAEWRRPYEPYATEPGYAELLSRDGGRPHTTSRPPGMPAVLAAIYAVAGRDWAAWRYANCGAVALALALAVVWAYRLSGPAAAGVTLLVSMQDATLYRLGREFWTEGLAALLVVLLALTLERLAQKRSFRDAIACGVILGLMWYVRTAFFTWYPWIALTAAWLLRGQPPRPAFFASGARNVRLIAVLLAAAVIVPLPWMIRNCVVLDAFMPNGTMYPRHMPAGFSDQAIEHRGRWTDTRAPGETSEVEAALASQARARKWIRENFGKIPRLTGMKIATEWRRWRERSPLIWIVTVLGVLVTLRRPFGMITLAAVIATTACVAVTWSVGGRFVAPIHPLLHIATGVGTWTIIEWLWRKAVATRPSWLGAERRAIGGN